MFGGVRAEPPPARANKYLMYSRYSRGTQTSFLSLDLRWKACVGAYILFNHPLSLHRCMEDFSAVTMFKYPKELKFQGMHKLKVRTTFSCGCTVEVRRIIRALHFLSVIVYLQLVTLLMRF